MIRRPFIPLDSFSKFADNDPNRQQLVSPCKEISYWNNTPVQTRNQQRRNNELLQSPSFFINSGYHQGPYSNNRRSSIRQKITTINNSFKKFDEQQLDVRDFDDQFHGEQSSQWMNSQQRRMRFFMQPSYATTAKMNTLTNITYFPDYQSSQPQIKIEKESHSKDDSFLIQEKLALVQKHMMQLHSSIEDLENQFREKQINDQLGFLKTTNARDIQINQKSTIQEKIANDEEEEVPFRVFYPNTQCDNTIIFGPPNQSESFQLTFMQQKISDMISHISQFLQRNQNFAVKQENDSNEEVQVFTYNKGSNKFIRVYKCKFCDVKFSKACSLGGHISRVHKEESQRMKIMMKPIKKNHLNKKRKDIILNNINRNVYHL